MKLRSKFEDINQITSNFYSHIYNAATTQAQIARAALRAEADLNSEFRHKGRQGPNQRPPLASFSLHGSRFGFEAPANSCASLQDPLPVPAGRVWAEDAAGLEAAVGVQAVRGQTQRPSVLR